MAAFISDTPLGLKRLHMKGYATKDGVILVIDVKGLQYRHI